MAVHAAGGALDMHVGSAAGPVLAVKNTFLDFVDADEPPGMTRLVRAHTTPVPKRPCSEDSDDPDPHVDTQANKPIDDSQEGDDIPPPPMEELYRVTTNDGYECLNQWSWGMGEQMPMVGVPGVPSLGNVPSLGCQGFPSGGYMVVGVPVMVPPYPVPGTEFGEPPLPTPELVADAPPSEPPQTFGANAAGATGPGDASSSTASGIAGPEGVSVPNLTVDVPPLQPPPRPQVLHRDFSVASSVYRIHWAVDARKLNSTDREAVSPAFDLGFNGDQVQFKMVIRPKLTAEARGGASFKKAKGKGSVEVRCLGEVDPETTPPVVFRIWIGSGGKDSAKKEEARGPVEHKFSERTICGLPEGQQEWDFNKVVDDATKTFVVCLEILAGFHTKAGT